MTYSRKAHWQVEWGRALDNRQDRATLVNQADGVSDMVLPLFGCVVGRVQKGDNAAAWPLELCPGGSCPLALSLMPDTSISPCMLLVPFQLLPWC